MISYLIQLLFPRLLTCPLQASQYDPWSEGEASKYLLILEAYETLREEESRAEYDREGRKEGRGGEQQLHIRDPNTEFDMFPEERKMEGGIPMEDRDKEVRDQMKFIVHVGIGIFMLITVPKAILFFLGTKHEFYFKPWQ